MMRSPNAISITHRPDELWQMAVTLLLTNAPAQRGNATYSLSSMGCSRTTTSHAGRIYEAIGRSQTTNLMDKCNLQNISENEEVLFFVEGDRPSGPNWV
jgi:hypothetical protein